MNPSRIRCLLAQEAARILAEEGRQDYLKAKRKAAERLGLGQRHLPTNLQIRDALADHLRLFAAAPPAGAHLRRLRRTAHAAMVRLLAGIETRAAGTVTEGFATAHSVVELHVFVEPPERLAMRLIDQGLDFQAGERRLHWGNGRTHTVPLFKFDYHGQPIEALAFALNDLREPPADPLDSRPARRIGLRTLKILLDETPAAATTFASP